MVKTELLLTGQKTIHMAASKTEHDLLGSVIGYIGGKDSRVTGSSLPVYKGKLTVQRDARPLRTPAQQLAVNDYLKKYTEPAAEEKKKKKRKKKTDGVRIIDNDEGLGGIALATAKGAKTLSDEELSDEQGVIVEEQELKRMQEEREKRFSVQVGDGGDGGSSWVTVDEDGNVLKPAGETDRPGAGSKATRDQSPPRRPGAGKRRHDSDDDQSPPRRGAAATDSATGGSGRKRDSDGDQSPPRRSGAGGAGRRDADGDQSPPRRGPPPGRGPTVKSDPDRDQSPPRHSTKAVGRKRHDSDADQSPPRRASPAAARKGHESNGDQSPPRRGGGGPPGGGGKRARHDADGDQSPPRKAAAGAGDRAGGRKRHDSDDDQSPPRRGSGGGGGGGAGPSGRRRHDSDSDGDGRDRKAGGGAPGPVAPGQRTVSGLRAGYVEGKELEDAMRRKKETEDRRFGALTDDVTGRVAATVYRDKSGKRVAQDTEARKAAMSKEEKEEAELKNMVWGKGLVQLEEKAALEAQVEAEKSKPFARTADDAELNDHLKGVQRWGDPMAGKLRPTDKPSRPKYRGPYPPNRFGIMPGYRWDGVDRSTGFERKWFAAQSARQAKEHAAHMWSVESM